MYRNAFVTRRKIVFGAVTMAMMSSPLRAEGSAAGKVNSLHGGAFAEGTNSRRTLASLLIN